MEKTTITYPEFVEATEKLSIRVGQVVIAERIPKKDKLLKLTVIFGADESDERIVVTNLGGEFEPDDFLAMMFPFVMNLEPSKIGGILSEAMIMVFKDADDKVILDGFMQPSMGSTLF